MRQRRATSRACSSWRSTGSPTTKVRAMRGRQRADSWPAGFGTARTGSSGGSGDRSSQAGAMQSGILQGSNWDMPWSSAGGKGYRAGELRLEQPEERRRDRAAPHERQGAAEPRRKPRRANLVSSGDAPHSMITMSTLLEKRQGRLGHDYLAFFSNPYDVTRTFIPLVKEIVAELWQQTQQKRLDIKPRVHRGWFPIRSPRCYTKRAAAGARGLRHDPGPVQRTAGDLHDVPRLRRGRPPLRHRTA